MKDLFRNTIGYNTVCIKIQTQGHILEFFYHLSDNPVQHQWQKFHREFFGGLYKTDPLYKTTIEEINRKISDLAKQKGYDIPEALDQTQLNFLHSEFVKNQSDDMIWHNINTYIHLAEDKKDIYNDFNSTVCFTTYPESVHVPLPEEYKLWLTADQCWGDLYMGYSTVGKSWEDIAEDNDGLDDLEVQSILTPETCMHFQIAPPWKKFAETKFYNWAKRRTDVPLNNLNKLGLGKYYLGKLIITESFINFHSNISDWYVPNHSCKLKWNKEVIGSDAEVVAIEFFESDMYYDSLMQHTGFNND
jgi:hypothetical protein